MRAGSDDAGVRLDRFLAGAVDGLSRSRIKALIEAGRLAAGGATIAEASYRVKPGQEYELSVPAAAPAAPRGQAIELAVVYEYADMIVVYKPAGKVVHPAPGHPRWPCTAPRPRTGLGRDGPRPGQGTRPGRTRGALTPHRAWCATPPPATPTRPW